MLNSLKTFLKSTPLSRIYSQYRMRREFWNWTERDEAALLFYRQFIHPGETVIDVGANRGNRAKIFIKLGAHTVLVEPQASCVHYLKIVLRDVSNWVLIEKALGATEGELEMFISPDDVLSTLSPRWLSVVKNSGRFGEVAWDKRQKTPVTTLDEVIRKQGTPSFIKIDVEGYEKEVVSGLSAAPRALSFEFVPEYMENAFACMDHLLSLSEFEFQVSFGESLTFDSDKWLSSADLRSYLNKNKALLNSPCFGDIYARKIQK